MSSTQILQLFDLLLLAILPLLPSIFVAVAPHPTEVQRGAFRALLLVLGRLSLLRHGDSPGTLHLPLTAQPAPVPELAGELQRLPPDGQGQRGVEVQRGGGVPMGPPGGLGLVLPVLALAALLLPACQSFAQLAELARRTYDAASDAEERAPDDETKRSARTCGKAARDAVRAADAAQQALVDRAPGYGALKGAADQAELRMKAACRPLRLDVAAVPPAAPDLGAPRPPADLRPAATPAAPDMGSGPAAPAAPPAPVDIAPRPPSDGGMR